MKILIFNNIDTLGEDFINRCEDFLPKWRKDQMLKYKFQKGRIQNGLAYVLLVKLLRDECGDYVLENLPEFSYNDHEKPFLKNYPERFFSISHCQTAVAVALADSPVGIDIEDITRYKENVATYVSNDSELKKIKEDSHPEEVFIRLWTQKEAVFKYNGTGITDDMKNILNNIDCQLFSYKFGNKFISVATNEICTEDVFSNIFVNIGDIDFI